jgi:hypothetical protein
MNIDRYKQLSKSSYTNNSKKIETSIPLPKDVDYKRGYINRYFIQKVNDKGSPIYELNSTTFQSYKNKAQFSSVSLKWRIVGPTLPQYDSKGVVIDKPVSDSNRIAIQLVAHTIPNLKLYLPNLLQFYKN